MTTETPATPADEAKVKKDVVPQTYRDRYKATGGTTGDFVGVQLQTIGKDGLVALYAVMKENGIPQTRWAALNPGQQRMNLSNVLRSRLFKGEDITILGKQHNINHMREDYNGTLDKDKPESIRKFLQAHDMKADDRTVAIVIRTFYPPDTAARKEEARLLREEKAKDKADAKAQKVADAAKAKAAKAEAAATAKAEKAKAAAAAKAEKAKAAAAAKAAKKPAPAKKAE